ncbi:hypothetical protein DL771_008516 [Monosporascus sp. 5C6A]|nr:hypothetical protein DL771_008516 [Monosporascus sp. 5C6A]
MPLIVLPALEAELEPFYNVWFAAFKGQAVVSVLFPGGADRKVQIQYIKQGWGQVGHPIKCVDTDTGEIVGIAIWEILWRPGEENGWEKPDRIPWLSGEDWDKAKGVILPMWDMREKLFGKRRHVCELPNKTCYSGEHQLISIEILGQWLCTQIIDDEALDACLRNGASISPSSSNFQVTSKQLSKSTPMAGAVAWCSQRSQSDAGEAGHRRTDMATRPIPYPAKQQAIQEVSSDSVAPTNTTAQSVGPEYKFQRNNADERLQARSSYPTTHGKDPHTPKATGMSYRPSTTRSRLSAPCFSAAYNLTQTTRSLEGGHGRLWAQD